MISRLRVLIIDVDRRTVDRLQELFIQSGYEAEVALSPSVGLSIVNERQMSVAIMSAESGSDENWRLVRRMKETDPNLPVVLFDAPKVKGLSREARRAGVQRCLTTPMDAEAVRNEAIKVMRN
jgi:DNA-binding response OmpR family regulator